MGLADRIESPHDARLRRTPNGWTIAIRNMRYALFTLLIGTLMVAGCSSEARNRFKHWFFEIPDETTGTTADHIAGDASQRSEILAFQPTERSLIPHRFTSMHPPFLLRSCQECHDSSNRMVVADKMLVSCQRCHSGYFREAPGHFPTTEGQCTECHNMHRSSQPALLNQPLYDVCIECHDEAEDLSQPIHTVAYVERCTACHDPHFGESPLLRTNAQVVPP